MIVYFYASICVLIQEQTAFNTFIFLFLLFFYFFKNRIAK